ncbi:MAG: hypothetical protein ACOCVZ_00615, partial [Gemmatimonadota bacterium]
APPEAPPPTEAEPPAPARGHAGAPSGQETRHPRHQDTAPADPRFTLEGVDVHRSHGRAECTVRLRLGGRSSAGAARESDTGAGRARAAARAALAAVETLDPALRLGLHGIRRVDLFGHGAIVVLVEATAGRSHEHLPGSALLDRSEEEAAALATINALREWME